MLLVSDEVITTVMVNWRVSRLMLESSPTTLTAALCGIIPAWGATFDRVPHPHR
jgi:hypothetical protein